MRLLLLFILLSSTTLGAQVKYAQDLKFSKNNASRSLIAVGIADINGDKRDDIIRVKDGKQLEILYIDDHGASFSVNNQSLNYSETWSLAVANLTNDLRNEIVVSRAFSDSYIVKTDADQRILQHQRIPNNAYSQSTSIADIDNDGWLDVFVASDDSKSTILRNDGTGKLIKDENIINLSTRVLSDDSGNYGSEWADIDSDGDIDLYISKCKAGVTNPNDPRRINMLFINDGNHNYTEMAAAYGLNFGQQSWASNFGDLDNDGDLDGIVIQHGSEHTLLENINNQFVDRSVDIDNLTSFAFQVLMRDFDNNGYQDILITGDKDYMLWNQGDFSFDIQESPFVHYNMISMATGDINRDGFLDVLGVYGGNALNAPGHVSDVLWLAEANQNHFVNFALNGSLSNKSGVGARIVIHGPWGTQTREVKAGESYSISNSLNVHFGLADWDTIEKVEVYWPSGQKDVHRNIPSDRFYLLNEGSCISPIKSSSSPKLICEESIKLESPSMNTMWQDGSQSTTFSVEEEGVYFSFTDDFGCLQLQESSYIRPFDQSIIQVPDVIMNCNDEPFLLEYSDEFGEVIQIDRPANNSQSAIEVPTICGSKNISINVIPVKANLPKPAEQTYQKGDDVTIDSEDNTIWNWYLNEDSSVPFYRGESLFIADIDTDRKYYVESEQSIKYTSIIGGEKEQIGTSSYSANVIPGQMFFHVHKQLTIEEFTVYTDTPGVRQFEIFDNTDQKVFQVDVDLKEGANIVTLNADLIPGKNYYITTNSVINQENFGYVSPRLERSNQRTNYPYFLDNIMTLVNSNIGPAYYLYFYNIKVRQTDFICKSERIPVNINVELSTAVDEEYSDEAVRIFPNPTADYVTLDFPKSYKIGSVSVFNTLGQRILHFQGDTNYLDVTSLVPGQYIISLNFAEQTIRTQLTIVK